MADAVPISFDDIQLSILYWHVIDSQSFPLEVSTLPNLSAKGAYSTDEVYSEEDVQQIIAYANAVSTYRALVWFLLPHFI